MEPRCQKEWQRAVIRRVGRCRECTESPIPCKLPVSRPCTVNSIGLIVLICDTVLTCS